MKSIYFLILVSASLLACEKTNIFPLAEPVEQLSLSWYFDPTSDEGRAFVFRFKTELLERRYNLTFEATVEGRTILIRLIDKTKVERCPDYPGNYPSECRSWEVLHLSEDLLSPGEYVFIVEAPKFKAEGEFSYQPNEAILRMEQGQGLFVLQENTCIQQVETLVCGFSYGGATNDSLITSILSGLEQLGLSRISPHEAFGGCLSASFPDTIIYRSYESGGRIRYSRQMFYHYPQDISFSDLKKAIDPTYEFMWRNPHISQPDWSMGFWSGFGDFLGLSDRANPRIIVGER